MNDCKLCKKDLKGVVVAGICLLCFREWQKFNPKKTTSDFINNYR